jgi:hypothetical protein
MTDLEKPKMDDEYIIQNDIVVRYLRNKLTADEIIAFEEYAMDKPELLEQLELDSVLMETLPDVLATPQKLKTILTKFNWKLVAMPILGISLAMNVGFYMVTATNELATPASSQIAYLDMLRNSPDRKFTLSLENNKHQIVLVISPSKPGIGEYTVSLAQKDKETIFSGKFFENSENELVISVPTELLTTQNYVLNLSAETPVVYNEKIAITFTLDKVGDDER